MSDNKPKKTAWYSIKEAAGYLEIGEPTLYRWMRERKITFRKVGDSTRFLQEDLDAVVEVHHSQKQAAEVKNYCPLCRSENMVPGDFRTTGLNYFQPRQSKFWTLRSSSIKSEAFMCIDCGHISIFGDKEKLAKLCRQAPPPGLQDAEAEK